MIDAALIAQAAAVLKAGGLVGMPTETVYGLAADASRAETIAKIYAAKGRPSDHPVIVHLAHIERSGTGRSKSPRRHGCWQKRSGRGR